MKTKLLRNTLIAVTFLFSISATAQFDFTFDTDGDFEGFTVNGPGASGTVAGGLLSATGTGANIQLRRNATNIGDPTTLTTVVLNLKNNSNADRVLVQMGAATVFTQVISTADATEQSYQIDITDVAWVGEFQFRLRFIIDGGGVLDGNAIEINGIQIVDPASLSVDDNALKNFSIYPNPATGFVNVKSLQEANVQVYNIVGKQLISENKLAGEHRMDISDLATGVYLMKVTTSEGQTRTKKLVIN